MSVPNIITLFRILLVPTVVWAIGVGETQLAFWLFLTAGVSDALDGFIAKRFGMQTELGAYLDPLADKALIVSIYITLAIVGIIPVWLVVVGLGFSGIVALLSALAPAIGAMRISPLEAIRAE